MRDVVVRHGARIVLQIDAFSVAFGEVVALVGPNGAGKTTLLHVAALLRRRNQGDVVIGGEQVTRRSSLALRRRTALVFQDALLFDRSVMANAASGLRFRGVGRRDAEARAMLWLDRFGVAHLAHRSARFLSGGEAQRVSLARAFAVGPELLLLDEPFSALDSATRDQLIPDLGHRLRETNTAAIFVTHDLDEALAFADRLGVMLTGRLAQIGKPDAVITGPATVEVARFLGIENLVPAIVVAVNSAAITVATTTTPSVTLRLTRPERGIIHPESRGVLAIRAVEIDIRPRGSDLPAGWNTLPGRIVAGRLTRLGHTVDVDCGIPLRVFDTNRSFGRTHRAGQDVILGIAPDAIHLIETST